MFNDNIALIQIDPNVFTTCIYVTICEQHDFNNRDVLADSGQDNLTGGERRALKQIQNMPNIIIKAADKGITIVFQSRQQYLEKGSHNSLTPSSTQNKNTEIHQNGSEQS